VGSGVGADNQSRRVRGRDLLLHAWRIWLLGRVRKKIPAHQSQSRTGPRQRIARAHHGRAARGKISRRRGAHWQYVAFSLYQAKVLQPVASAFILPEVKDESKWWLGKHQYVDSEGKYIFVPVGSVSVNMVAHNSELVSPAQLSSFWDLLNEKWRGKIVVMDPRSGGYGRSGARMIYYHSQLGAEYLRRLFTEQIVMLSRDYRQAIDWLAQRRFSLLLFGNGDDVLQAKAQGLPVDVSDTSGWKEGGALEPGAFTLVWLDRSPHPNASKVFINWLLSREGQMAVQRDGEINDSLRVDISKNDLRPMARRKEGAKYMVTWKAEWMDAEPMQKVVNQALAKSGKKP
jgi:ABC-type Fe3+ transport system substrate-binding protein